MRKPLTDNQRLDHYVWFRVTSEIEGAPVPFFICQGSALTPEYHSLTNIQQPMPDHIIIKICLSHGGLYGSAQGKVPLKPGQAIVRIFGEREVWDCYDPNHSGPWEFLGLIFRGPAAMVVVQGLIKQFGRILSFPLDGPALQRLMTISKQPSHFFDIAAADAGRLVMEVLMTLAEHSEEPQTSHGSDHLVYQAVRTIQQRIEDDLNVSELADILDVSREHLARSFRETLGQGPASRITQEKISEACRLLRYTQLPIKSVMHRVGYTSNTVFYRAFRRFAGMPPGQFRQQGRLLVSSHFADVVADSIHSEKAVPTNLEESDHD
ncbi:MAG: AraC family transcriptional regulator [Planctomycetota bacterium]